MSYYEENELEDSLEDVEFVPSSNTKKSFPSIGSSIDSDNIFNLRRIKEQNMNLKLSYNNLSNNRNSLQNKSYHSQSSDISDTDSLEDSLVYPSKLRESKDLSNLKAKIDGQARRSLIAGHDEAILIQKAFRGYIGRKISARCQLLRERERIRSRDELKKQMSQKHSIRVSNSYSSTKSNAFETIPGTDGGPPIFLQRANKPPIATLSVNPSKQSISSEGFNKFKQEQHSSSNDESENDDPEDSLERVHIQHVNSASTNNNKSIMSPSSIPKYINNEASSNVNTNNNSSNKSSSRPHEVKSQDTSKQKVKSGASEHKPPPSVKDLLSAAAQSQGQGMTLAMKRSSLSQISNNNQAVTSQNQSKIPDASRRNDLHDQVIPNPRQKIIQAQAKRAQAAVAIQRVFRGYVIRKLANIRRAMLTGRFACLHCGRIEQSGAYCKGCGRPRVKSIKKESKSAGPPPEPEKKQVPHTHRRRPTLETVIEDRNESLQSTLNATKEKTVNVPVEKNKEPAITNVGNRNLVSPTVSKPQVSKGFAMSNSTIELQTEERKLLLELAAIDNLQQQKLRAFQQNIRDESPVKAFIPQPFPRRRDINPLTKLESKSTASDSSSVTRGRSNSNPRVSVRVGEEKPQPIIRKSEKVKEENELIKKEKVAFTAGAKDYKSQVKPMQSKAQPTIPQQTQINKSIVDTRNESKDEPIVPVIDSSKNSLLSVPAKSKIGILENPSYNNPGYLSEYHKKHRASSAGRSRPTEVRSEGTYAREHMYNDSLETVSLPAITQKSIGSYAAQLSSASNVPSRQPSKSAPPKVGESESELHLPPLNSGNGQTAKKLVQNNPTYLKGPQKR